MYVEDIFWIEDEEADVYVSDGKITLKCFSYPCKLKKGDVVNTPLECLGEENIMLYEPSENTSENEIAVKGTYEYNYHLVGKYIGEGLIRVSDIDICVNKCLVPKDIRKNSVVCFDVDRLDIY